MKTELLRDAINLAMESDINMRHKPANIWMLHNGQRFPTEHEIVEVLSDSEGTHILMRSPLD